MATLFGEVTTVVRRKGGLSVVTESLGDHEDPVYFSGDRRSRQIATRHWLRQTVKADSSGGYYYIRRKSPIGG